MARQPLMSRVAYSRKQGVAAEARRQQFLDITAQTGKRPGAVSEEMGMSVRTYFSWRQKYPDFAAKVDEARRSYKTARKKFDGTFASFREMYLNMKTTWFQALIADAIEKSRPGEVVLVLIPPAHGKTTLLEDWCTYKICTDPSFRITVASETVDHGVKVVDRVRARLEPDGPTPLIHRDFGPLAPEEGTKATQVWGQRKFNVIGKRSSDERDFTMHAVGVTGRVQGTRCDLLLLDDMQDVKSLELSEKYFNIVTQSFLSRPEMFGRTVIIGTRVGEYDVYRRLIDAEIPDRVIRIPAYDVQESPVWPAPDRKPREDDQSTWAPEGVKFLWPEKYDQIEEGGAHLPGLERYRYASLRFRVKEQTWWRIYMQKPEAASSMTFDEETTSAMKDEHRSVIAEVRPVTAAEDPFMAPEFGGRRPVPVIIGVDPAVGGGNGVMACAARPKAMEVLSAHLDYGLTKYSQIIDLIEMDCKRFTTDTSVVTTVVVEDKAFQKGLLKDDSMMALQRRYGFRLIPNTTGREKTDPDIGVPAMPYAMLREEITIPWADEVSQKEMAPLLDHLHMWRPGVNGVKLPQDLVMTLWFCYRHWQAVRAIPVHQFMDTAAWRAPASPIRSTRRRSISRRGYSGFRRVR